jgi:hypothetical protein
MNIYGDISCLKFRVFWDVASCSHEVHQRSRGSIGRYIPEDSKLHTHHHKNLKSHISYLFKASIFCTHFTVVKFKMNFSYDIYTIFTKYKSCLQQKVLTTLQTGNTR